jgi:hypothetical protein
MRELGVYASKLSPGPVSCDIAAFRGLCTARAIPCGLLACECNLSVATSCMQQHAERVVLSHPFFVCTLGVLCRRQSINTQRVVTLFL